jgi:hypothetical protein
MDAPSGLRASAPRLIAEFFVIVIGVLGALAADQWVQDREDRVLEAEYLDRLRADAGYDREEIRFVQAVTLAGVAAIDSMLDPAFVERASDDALFSAALLAASARQVDLSRGTWEELVASGRIALLKDPEVRLALADYDRFVGEIAGYWEYTDNDLWARVMRRVPGEVFDTWGSACNPDDGSDRYSTSQSTSTCELGAPPGSAESIRSDAGSPEAVGELRLQRVRYRGLVGIVEALLSRLDELERVLNAAR